MKDFYLNCPKGQGAYLGNFIRQAAYSTVMSWRPVAYLIDVPGANLLTAGGDFAEDMIDFANSLVEHYYQPNALPSENVDFLTSSFSFNGTFKNSDLANGSTVSSMTDGPDLLHCITDKEINVFIYFRRSRGVHTIEENTSFLESRLNGKDNKIKVMASAHTPVRAFSASAKSISFDEEELHLKVDALSEDDTAVLTKSLDSVIELVQNIRNQLQS